MERRNGALDVLRAVAIAAVVLCHSYSAFVTDGTYDRDRAFGIGGRGVDLFFLLSGWLLGHQLLAERQRTGTIDVRRFWLRRALRILPAYYLVLAVQTGQAVHARGPEPVDAAYLVFAQNYLPRLPYFAHSWSLCVEEHFYLLVGPTLLLVGRFRWAGPLVCALLMVPTVCRVMGWYASHGMFETHVRFDQCAAGVALAWVAVERPRWWAGLCRIAVPMALATLAAALYQVFGDVIHWASPGGVYDAADTAFWTVTFATWVLAANSDPWFAGWFDRPPTRYLANRAYAVYLLHVDAISAVKRLGDLPAAAKFALVWVVSLLAAEVLYRLVELPFMRLRERFAVTRSRRG